MKTTRMFVPALVVLFLFGVGGCYTILKHPAGESEAGHEYSQEYYRENCVKCHPDYHEYPYGFYNGYYPDYYFSDQRWGRYYAYPWWWDYYSYGSGDQEVAPGAVEGDAHDKMPRSRDMMAPPYIEAGTSTFQGSGGLGGGGVKPTGTGTPAAEQTGESDGKTKATATSKTDTSSDSNATSAEKKRQDETGKKAAQPKKRPH